MLPAEADIPVPQAEQRLRALQRQPALFGPDVAEVEWIETHISWLLLAGDRVYKFKKPLKLDFLDFSTRALRRAACEEELRINRRTAPSLYLGLVGLSGTAAQGLRLQPLEQAPQDAEPAVCMRRFAQDDLLLQRLQDGQLGGADMDALACEIARFHASAAVAGTAQGWGTPLAVQAPVRDCLAALQAQADSGWAALVPALQSLAPWCQQQGAALAPVFEARRLAGRVRECHGDLHLGNLVLLEGQPQAFDAIEFNPALRWIDVVADIAFLVMDLQARDRADGAWRFLDGWLAQEGDFAGMAVLRYYTVYRALVRARVAGMRATQALPASAQAMARAECAQYLALACQCMQPRSAELWLTHGLSGSGKSTQALGLVQARGVVRLRADVERKRLFGLTPGEDSTAIDGGIYTPQATERTYEHLRQQARLVLQSGYTVLVDASFLDPAMRAPFLALAQELGVVCRILAFEAPLAVLRERVRARQQAGGDPSEADEAVLLAQWAARQPFSAAEQGHVLRVDTTRAVDWDHLLPAAHTK